MRYGRLDPLDHTSTKRILYQHGKEGSSRDSEAGLGKATRRRKSLSMLGEGMFTHSVPGKTFKISTRNKMYELILQHPTDYSQSAAAAKLMLGAYGSKYAKETTGFEWTEVFPVFRRQSWSYPSRESRQTIPFLCPVIGASVDLQKDCPKLKLPNSTTIAQNATKGVPGTSC